MDYLYELLNRWHNTVCAKLPKTQFNANYPYNGSESRLAGPHMGYQESNKLFYGIGLRPSK